ncbi:hypothetical protein ZYGR_0U02410 [Zygosaccharomyces rouxii]|uniref:ZYRO0F14168p n=2 Tax=Zygosaccharomyces rouxii TaxID=4956 RepID=C5DYM2_ZYGRC|nr:uncharacterized protein ZYRO0F14168g [Zygosaccharomyces rouxii]KAH9199640.1 hypothetical protein LQ764DRAFT_225861 [Zygosaccharomyces rouxii]GAV50385.1 hypothetical protein ZYGR_0U02410 [Zygosaccharomyces rouxii]CAR28883.1 ZYRO0F14168p [Zygosaccharomyces rouxii]
MSLPSLEISKSSASEENLDNVSKPISSGTLRSSSVPSPASVNVLSQGTRDQGNLSELSKSSWQLQNEINGIFEELCSVNRQVRVDIDDFCHIRDNSTTNINNATQVD